MRGFMRFALVTGAMLLVSGAVIVCRPSETPAADKDPKIWTEGTTETAPVVPSGFSPMQGFSVLVKKVQPAVVNINTTTEVKARARTYGRRNPQGAPNDFLGDDLFRHFFGDDVQPPSFKRNSLGSGLIVNPDGYVLTNNHVVADATEILVKLDEGREFKAKVVGRDERYDLALLKIDSGKDKLPAVTLGDSDKLEVGDWVVAIGSPFGLAHTVTAGIVSAKDRVIGAGPLDDFIQTDASINPGNSGGPLFDATGLVVGINTAIHASGQGIGFAVPINMAKTFIRDVMTKGRVSHGWLGVGIQELNADLAKGLGLSTTSGVLVSQVFPGSPALKAGFKRGDVIVTVAGRRVDQPSDLTRVIGTTSPGSSVDVKVVRDGKEVTLSPKIAEQEGKGLARGDEAGDQAAPESAASLGIRVREMDSKLAAKLGLGEGQGVVVEAVAEDGPAAETGVVANDVIMEVNRQPVATPADYAAQVAKVKPGDSVMLLVLRGGDRYFYVVVRKP